MSTADQIRRARRILAEMEAEDGDRREAPAYDWFGDTCPCELPPGECKVHPRARLAQRPPAGDWRFWAYIAGRGSGKTRAGAEWVRDLVASGKAKRIALVAPTAADARDVMVEGESGIMAISPPWDRPRYEPSKCRLTWPNGAIATTYSAEEPDRLRGPQFDAAWLDELAAWTRPKTWDMLLFGLRLGSDPRAVITTTPRPTHLVRSIVGLSTTVMTQGSTFDNRIHLADAFIEQTTQIFEGTTLGRQELYGELLKDAQGALWSRDQIDNLRVKEHPHLTRIVVAVDPSGGDKASNDEVGLVVVGMDAQKHGWVLADHSGRMSPQTWGSKAVALYRRFEADRIVAEANFGGAMVESTIRVCDRSAPVKLVHASRGKQARAEPVAALYEQGRFHHVGAFTGLEDEMATWVPGESTDSPNRVDALVWAGTELLVSGPGEAKVRSFATLRET